MSQPRPGTKIGNFEFEKRIGEGAFATVWKGHHTMTNSPVAIKIMKKESIDTPAAQTRFIREISLLKKMRHPFIAQFYQMVEDETYYYIVMEYVENGNLLEHVNNNGRLNEEQARRYFAQLISALEYLHIDQKVAHRDLKCENVLLDKYHNIRLIDFGLSNVFSELNPELKTACGSPAYAAPEMIKGNTYTIAADIWSAGILLYAIVVGTLPYDDDNIQRLLQKIVFTECNYPSFVSPQLTDLLQKMLNKDPDNRITLEMIKSHPWFSTTEYNNMMNLSIMKTNDGTNKSIDRDIVEQINQLGLDTSQLHSSLLSNELTSLTSLYWLLERQKLTEEMKDLMRKISIPSATPFKTPLRQNSNQMIMKPPTASPRPAAFPGSKPAPAGQQRVLPMPVAATGQRRFSRPVALRRPVPMNGNMPNPQSLEVM